jgi:CRP-like cAMP-binding protein
MTSDIHNSLLTSLPREAYRQLSPELSSVSLPSGTTLGQVDRPMSHVYFPTGCVVSLLAKVEGHAMVEVGMVGREGIVGMRAVPGVKPYPMQAMVRCGGSALRIGRSRFQRAFRDIPDLQLAIWRSTHELMVQMLHSAVCNRFHRVDERMARWLLMSSDRACTAQILITQNDLSNILGVRRESVTAAAFEFKQLNLIEYSRGKIRILDRPGLEAAACSCSR